MYTVTLLLFFASIFVESVGAVQVLWTLSCVVHLLMPCRIAFGMAPRDSIPLNIGHFSERLGCGVLVMLGESVVSATLKYNSLHHTARSRYYAGLFFVFLLVFGLCLMFFHVRPPHHLHALRRSRLHAVSCMTMYEVLSACVLAIGVGVKRVMEHIIDDADASMPPFAVWLLAVGVSASLLSLFVLRVLHYWGRRSAGVEEPSPIKRLKAWWWALLGFGTVVPLIMTSMLSLVERAALTVVGVHACTVAVLLVAESCYVHYFFYTEPSSSVAKGAPLAAQADAHASLLAHHSLTSEQ
eukprot:TRINITY_DN59720_c0_g1_i1.p2 TRINITY_DN59720_c0_g1~~TRINITY_DN59720_c0_g1_i1.p2  ORF type:complete len:297 (+),score=132.57 TRINITY_DN59720_c0_g1_i1:590-1480(+)